MCATVCRRPQRPPAGSIAIRPPPFSSRFLCSRPRRSRLRSEALPAARWLWQPKVSASVPRFAAGHVAEGEHPTTLGLGRTARPSSTAWGEEGREVGSSCRRGLAAPTGRDLSAPLRRDHFLCLRLTSGRNYGADAGSPVRRPGSRDRVSGGRRAASAPRTRRRPSGLGARRERAWPLCEPPGQWTSGRVPHREHGLPCEKCGEWPHSDVSPPGVISRLSSPVSCRGSPDWSLSWTVKKTATKLWPPGPERFVWSPRWRRGLVHADLVNGLDQPVRETIPCRAGASASSPPCPRFPRLFPTFLATAGCSSSAAPSSMGGPRWASPARSTSTVVQVARRYGAAVICRRMAVVAALRREGSRAGGSAMSLRPQETDGSAAVPLGEGFCSALSPDGKWAVCRPEFFGPSIRFAVHYRAKRCPTPPERRTRVSRGRSGSDRLPDGEGFLFTAKPAGAPRARIFVLNP